MACAEGARAEILRDLGQADRERDEVHDRRGVEQREAEEEAEGLADQRIDGGEELLR